jgi:hypothetical protein
MSTQLVAGLVRDAKEGQPPIPCRCGQGISHRLGRYKALLEVREGKGGQLGNKGS